MGYKVSLGLQTYQFSDLKTVMAKASPLRSGDCLSGVAALSNEERVAAALVLADLPLKRFLEEEMFLSVYVRHMDLPLEVCAMTKLELQ